MARQDAGNGRSWDGGMVMEEEEVMEGMGPGGREGKGRLGRGWNGRGAGRGMEK